MGKLSGRGRRLAVSASHPIPKTQAAIRFSRRNQRLWSRAVITSFSFSAQYRNNREMQRRRRINCACIAWAVNPSSACVTCHPKRPGAKENQISLRAEVGGCRGVSDAEEAQSHASAAPSSVGALLSLSRGACRRTECDQGVARRTNRYRP